MIDIKQIRENREEFEKQLKKKTFTGFDLGHLLKVDDERLKLIKEVDDLRSEKNAAALKRDIEKGKEIKARLEKLEHSLKAVEEEFATEYFKIQNPSLPDVPEGDESSNKILRKVGDVPKKNFKQLSHVELGENLDIIDIVRAAKVSGSRF